MSRHTRQTEEYSYAWGFNSPTGYFFKKFDKNAEHGDEALVFSIDSMFTEVPHPDYPDKQSYTNGEMLEIMDEEGVVPEEHMQRLALDLPF